MAEYRRKVIGTIDGITIYGQYHNEGGAPSVAVMHWKSWQIETDGVTIRFPTTGDDVGHMRVSDYWRLKEIIQSDVLDRLIEIGRDWVKTPPLAD